MAFRPSGIVGDLMRTIASLRDQWRKTRRESERLRQETEHWRDRAERLERERDHLREENDRLKRQFDDAQRAAKRQAAPFARGIRAAHPRRPGRKPGPAYGSRRRKAPPEAVDEVIAVPTPTQCPCGGAEAFEKLETQFQQEIVRKTMWRRYDVPIGRCVTCHRRVHGRDPRQTSEAFGAARVQLGPEALALGVTMNRALGMPHADVAAVLRDGFGLFVQRSTICRAVDRLARRGEATWHTLRDAACRTLANGIDETGWNVAAQLHWLWVVVNEQSRSAISGRDAASNRPPRSSAPTTRAGSRTMAGHRTTSFCRRAIRVACRI